MKASPVFRNASLVDNVSRADLHRGQHRGASALLQEIVVDSAIAVQLSPQQVEADFLPGQILHMLRLLLIGRSQQLLAPQGALIFVPDTRNDTLAFAFKRLFQFRISGPESEPRADDPACTSTSGRPALFAGVRVQTDKRRGVRCPKFPGLSPRRSNSRSRTPIALRLAPLQPG